MKYVRVNLAWLFMRMARKLNPAAFKPTPPSTRYEQMNAEIRADNLKVAEIKKALFIRLAAGLARSEGIERFMYTRKINGTEIVGIRFYFKLND